MIEIKNLSKQFKNSAGTVNALTDVSLSIEDGDIFGVIGLSGAGKSTLVRCINLLERPTDGQVIIDGVNLGELSEIELRKARRDITMIFQGFNLLQQRTNIKNVCFPLELEGVPKDEARAKALDLLELVGLKDKALAYPSQLSGGQQQRVAIARALATNPKVLLCDEATSALDPSTTSQILELISDINKKLGITVIIITHSMNVVESICKHVAILDGGKIVESGLVSEIFSRPKTYAAKRLVFPEGEEYKAIAAKPGEKYIRLVFNGQDITGKPIIAKLAVDKQIEANIIHASTRNIGDRLFGSMLLGISGDATTLGIAIDFFLEMGVDAEEVKLN